MQFAAVQEVEHLHHDESVENESKVSRINPEIIENSLVVISSRQSVIPSASNSSSDHTSFPLALRATSKSSLVEGVPKLRDESFPPEDKDNKHNQLEY